MGINLNPTKLLSAVASLTPGMGPMAGPLAALIKGIAGSQKGINDMKGALSQLMQGPFAKAGGAGVAQPAQRPQPFSPTVINIQIVMNPVGAMRQGPSAAGPLQSFAKAPEVGNDSQWGALANAVNSRITGNDKSFNMNATNPWQGGGDKTDMAAVAWAMQKNDKVRFNSDTKQFYVTNADGSTKNVASLDEVKGQIAKAGGASPSNGAAYNAVGSFINSRVNNSQSAATSQAATSGNPFEQLVNLLKKLLETLTGGAQGAQGSQSAAPASQISSGGSSAPASSGAASSSAPAQQGQGILDGAKGGVDSMIDRVGSKLESMQSEAERLMASDKPADQLKAQRMMQQINRMFEMMSKMIEDIGKKATSALKRSEYQPA